MLVIEAITGRYPMTEKNNYPVWPGWETVRLLGRGGSGAVYEIRRDIFGETETCAMKLISIPQNESETDELRSEGYTDASIRETYSEQLQHISREYSLVRRLSGAGNIVNCEDFRVVDHANGLGKTLMIRMEYLTPLPRTPITSNPESVALKLGLDLCSALILCEKERIIHRDIKPANIFVSKNGDYKLGDFGISRVMEQTTGTTIAGTPDYMAPEVYRGEAYGASVDLYSLGIVMYWLLNDRRTPFLPPAPSIPRVADRERARTQRLSGEEFPAPAHGSDALLCIIRKACAFLPDDRYHSAEAMRRDLLAVAQDKHLPVSEYTQTGMALPDEPESLSGEETIIPLKKEVTHRPSKRLLRGLLIAISALSVSLLLLFFVFHGFGSSTSESGEAPKELWINPLELSYDTQENLLVLTHRSFDSNGMELSVSQ